MRTLLYRNLGLLVLACACGLAFGAAVMTNGEGLCAAYGAEHGVKVRAVSFNEWDSCQFYDGANWRSAHTGEVMDRLRWSSR